MVEIHRKEADVSCFQAIAVICNMLLVVRHLFLVAWHLLLLVRHLLLPAHMPEAANPQLATGPQKWVVRGPVGELMNAASESQLERCQELRS